ncbi:hypothetical protein LTR28_010830, partial [Elasticomyces elasticus]
NSIGPRPADISRRENFPGRTRALRRMRGRIGRMHRPGGESCLRRPVRRAVSGMLARRCRPRRGKRD